MTDPKELFHSAARCMAELHNILGRFCHAVAETGDSTKDGGPWAVIRYYEHNTRDLICFLSIRSTEKTFYIFVDSDRRKGLDPTIIYALRGWSAAIGIECVEYHEDDETIDMEED